jgi:phage terminase small subunit
VSGKTTNALFDNQSDVITTKEKNDYERELALALAGFFTLMIPLFANKTMAKRMGEFNLGGLFAMNPEVKKYIKEISAKAAESHVNTVVEDVKSAVQKAFNENVKMTTDQIEASGRAVTDADLTAAREAALKGASQQRIISAVKTVYSNQITEGRAKAIARTETNRAFTQAQYAADKQFILQNGLEGRAYKKLETRSVDPCPVCTSLASDPPIPFDEPFANLGDTLSASYTDTSGKTRVQTIAVNFETITAGNIHTNCSCDYVLIIK